MQPFLNQGYVPVPDAPGLGVDLNEPVVKEHLRNERSTDY
jgi:L-alanine-DL-glutamate epimerase-like enolase superfamily enzyme